MRNGWDEAVEFPIHPLYIPATGKYQPYVVPGGDGPEIPPGATVEVPVHGYCGDVRRPPVPEGEPMPPVDDWIVPGDPAVEVRVPHAKGAGPPGRVLIPGTGQALPRGGGTRIWSRRLPRRCCWAPWPRSSGPPTSCRPMARCRPRSAARPRKSVKASYSRHSGCLLVSSRRKPYTKEEFTERLEAQYEERSGVPITAAPPEDQERVQQGADDFWDTFELVGVEAKIISHPQPL